MRIAVACNGFDVARRFDLAENVTLYNVVNGIITDCQNMPYPKQMDQASIASFFKSIEVAAIICNTIAIDDARCYCSEDIEVVAAVTGEARAVVEQYLTKTLIGADELCRGDDDDDFEFGEDSCNL